MTTTALGSIDTDGRGRGELVLVGRRLLVRYAGGQDDITQCPEGYDSADSAVADVRAMYRSPDWGLTLATDAPAHPTHLTHPQFLRALALARAHNHGWASEFDALGIDPAHRCEDLLDAPSVATTIPDAVWAATPHQAWGVAFVGQSLSRWQGAPGASELLMVEEISIDEAATTIAELGAMALDRDALAPTVEHYLHPHSPARERAWQRTRREKLADATPDETAALQRVELAWAVRGEVADADLRTLTLIGCSDNHDPGICSPGLDQDGDTSHETGSGRLEWLVRRDGSALLNVCRPGREMYRISVWSFVREESGFVGRVRIDGSANIDPLIAAAIAAARADRPLPRTEAEALIGVGEEEGALVAALKDAGFTVATRLPDDGEPTPAVAALMQQMDLLLELVSDGRESITVLSAEVGPAVTTREYADGTPATTPGHGYEVTRSPLAVTRETRGPGAELFWRHVETMRSVLSGLGVEWDPQLEVL